MANQGLFDIYCDVFDICRGPAPVFCPRLLFPDRYNQRAKT